MREEYFVTVHLKEVMLTGTMLVNEDELERAKAELRKVRGSVYINRLTETQKVE